MSEEKKNRPVSDDDYEREAALRRQRRLARRKRAIRQRNITLAVLTVLILASVGGASWLIRKNNSEYFGQGSEATGSAQTGTQAGTAAPEQTETPAAAPAEQTSTEAAPAQEPTQTADTQSLMEQARLMSAGYDYDGAVALLQTIPDYETDAAIVSAISEYQATKASCTAVDVTTVPHIFYHSLINNTDRAFNTETLGTFQVNGMNAWMTTVEEFDKITQAMYDNGYVFVRLRDLVVETENADGSVTFSPNTNLLLPPGKKAVVLSIDDLSYYHSYEKAGFPSKLVLDENGDVKCLYVTASGEELIGDYDVVPRLNAFLEEHPDGAYKGARGLIAMTGYNGVFGYRTDADYETRSNLQEDQAQWLQEHPDFNREEEIAQAKIIAEAIKADGWEFASHTWGHLSVTNKTVDQLRADNDKWVANVENIVGPVDTIIFAHGNDIGDWRDYSSDNEKYQYFKSAGYNFFCNVDGSQPYWVQIRENYVRQGRINLDGYMLYQASQGSTTVLDSMFTASQVFDSRRPTPVIASGEG